MFADFKGISMSKLIAFLAASVFAVSAYAQKATPSEPMPNPTTSDAPSMAGAGDGDDTKKSNAPKKAKKTKKTKAASASSATADPAAAPAK